MRKKRQNTPPSKAINQVHVPDGRETGSYSWVEGKQDSRETLVHEIPVPEKEEEKLRAAHLLLQSSIESHKDLLIFSIDTKYRYLMFNTAFQNATFYAYGTRISEGSSMLQSITRDEDRVRVRLNCDRALGGESHVTLEEYGEVQRHYYETRYNPIVDNRGNVIGVTVLSANVTERKRAEEEIRTLNRDLEAFSYSVAHDLRGPLRVIRGYSKILDEEYAPDLDGEARRLISSIENNARHMSQLIDDLLDFSMLGRSAIHRQAVDMKKLADEVIEDQVGDNGPGKIQFRVGDLLPANGDPRLLRHVFTNLIANAIKYSRKKDHPVIEVESNEREKEIVYTVKDNGSGFDMKYAEKLFGIFQRLHPPREFEGTGVGLAIVERIIRNHGGNVWAEGEVNNGATFYFSLPKLPA